MHGEKNLQELILINASPRGNAGESRLSESPPFKRTRPDAISFFSGTVDKTHSAVYLRFCIWEFALPFGSRLWHGICAAAGKGHLRKMGNRR